ncbi:hypothetical protein JW978_00035 [Candidatus Dojkabacteria bacterium]|nr:hypothetical protein [Candidatus Dojkabacteria bacterium]
MKSLISKQFLGIIFLVLVGVIISGYFLILTISKLDFYGNNSSAQNENSETVRVSLPQYEEDGLENDTLVSDSLEEKVEMLGDDLIKTQNEAAAVSQPASGQTQSPPASPPPLTNGTCPVSTQNCVPCNINDGHWACRVEPGKEEGYLGWSCQNNNPGNIRYSSARISYITKHGGPKPCGERIDSRGGTYMIFSTYQDGRNGLKAYMKAIAAATHTAYGECADGDCSLSYVFSKYAPGDPNYASYIAGKIGVSTSTSLQWVIENKFEPLIDAIQQKEGFFIL